LGPWGPRETPGREGFYINPSRRGPAVPGGVAPGATLRRRGGSPKGASGALPRGQRSGRTRLSRGQLSRPTTI